MRNIIDSSLFWFGLAGLLVLGIGIGLTAWQWIGYTETIPQLLPAQHCETWALLIAGGLAAVFAIWRGWVAERQSQTAQRQAEIADQNLLNDRYQRAAEMLGSANHSVRLGGIYSLQQLGEDYPSDTMSE